jgi:hypothetical protein
MDKKSPLTDWMIGKRGSCLDIKVYLKALEAAHTAGSGDGVQVSLASSTVAVSFQTAGNRLIAAFMANWSAFRGDLCGAPLLAPTWASRPIPQDSFFGCSDTVLTPPDLIM